MSIITPVSEVELHEASRGGRQSKSQFDFELTFGFGKPLCDYARRFSVGALSCPLDFARKEPGNNSSRVQVFENKIHEQRE